MRRISRDLAIASLVGALLVVVVAAICYRHVALNELVRWHSQANQAVIQALRDESLPVLSLVHSRSSSVSEQRDTELDTRLLRAAMMGQLRRLPGGKITLFDAQGRVLVSSDAAMSAEDASSQEGLLRAEREEVVDLLPFKDPLYAFEFPLQGSHPIQTFQALRTAQGALIGVFRVDVDVTEPLKALERIQWTLVQLALSALGVLFLAMLFYVWRAEGRLRKQLDNRLSDDSKIRHKANHDALTGLPNRNLLQDRLEQALRQAKRQERRVVLMLIDLDGFKEVNDTLGHQAGDRLLQVVAKRLTECIREGDTVSRLGGDEFVLLFPLFDSRYEEPASEVASRILSSISQPLTLKGKEVKLGCSIGVSYFPDDSDNARDLIKCADTAMYRAKRNGRDNFQFFQVRGELVMAEPPGLEVGLQQAIERGELQLLYQPSMTLKENQVAGLQVSASWMHPKFGMVSAEHLQALAAKAGLTASLGEWILKTACAQLKVWRQSGSAVELLSIDLSVAPFPLAQIDQSLARVLAVCELEASGLEIRLSASQLRSVQDKEQPLLPKFQAKGGRVAVGDYLSSGALGDLMRLPINRIYLDSAMVGLLPEDARAAAIIRTMIALAFKLNISVVAEGVQNSGQLAFLHMKGCVEATGSYFSAPLPLVEIDKLMQSRRLVLEQTTVGVAN